MGSAVQLPEWPGVTDLMAELAAVDECATERTTDFLTAQL